MDFVGFPKIPRLMREIIITEKIDGTNAQIVVPEDPTIPLLAGSRTRWITPEKDNYGFARWVEENSHILRTELGPGTHFGEWWGQGIQRNYGLKTKKFSLFNVSRWAEGFIPSICNIVPLLYRGPFDQKMINQGLRLLQKYGSFAAPGFMQPEGIVIFHTAANHCFKITLENDEAKGQVK